jgi:hypothetical protein
MQKSSTIHTWHLAQYHTDMPMPLLALPRHLFILYKIGLNMGKPMGRHPHTHYIIPNTKKDTKRGRDPVIFASPCAPPSTGCRSPKIGQT